MAAQVVNFIVLLFIFKKLLYKPILKVLDERKKKIEESLKNAEEIEAKLQETNEKIDKMLAKALDEGQKIREESKKEASVYLEDVKQNASKLSQEIIKKGEEALRVEKEKMQTELRVEFSEIVAAALQKVTGKVLSKKDQKDMIEKSIKGLV